MIIKGGLDMFKRKFLAILAVTTMVMGSLSGCTSADKGEANNDNNTTGGDGVQTSDKGNDSEDEKIVLTLLSSIQTEESAELEQSFADAYMEQNENIEIEFIPCASNEVNKTVIQLATAKDLPDAFIMVNDFVPTAEDMGLIVDHTELLGQEYIDGLIPSIYNETKTVNGKMGYAPWFAVPSALIYRTDWLETAEMDTIETMDDMREAALKFTTDDVWGFSMVGTNNGSGTSRFLQYSRSFGVREVYEEDGVWKSDLTSDKYKAALQSYVELATKHKVVPPGAAEAGYPEASNYFAQGKTGMMITGSNAIGVILETNPDLQGKIGCVPIPKQEQHVSSINGMGYAITTQCEHPEEMADFLKFMTSTENAVAWTAATGRLPVTQEATEAPELQDPAYQGFFDSMQYAISTPQFEGYQELNDVIGESYNSMLGGSVSIDDAMARVTTRVEEILGKYNK